MFKKTAILIIVGVIVLSGCNLFNNNAKTQDYKGLLLIKYNEQNAMSSRTEIIIKNRKYQYLTELFMEKETEEVIGELTEDELNELIEQTIHKYQFFRLPKDLSNKGEFAYDAPTEKLEITYGSNIHVCLGYDIQDKRFRNIVGLLNNLYLRFRSSTHNFIEK